MIFNTLKVHVAVYLNIIQSLGLWVSFMNLQYDNCYTFAINTY
jgi:hypothetical protein